MRDYLVLGPVPYGEECVQVGDANFNYLAKKECQRYKDALSLQYPNAHFNVKSFPHDFGSYYEVVVWFDSDDEKSVDLAFDIERNVPESWSDFTISSDQDD